MQARGNNLDLGSIASGNGTLPLSGSQRSTHLHVVGSTVSGKSKFLEHLIRQDIMANRRSGCGVLVIDPHGSLYDSLMSWMAFNQLDRDLVPIDLRRDDWVIAYNLLRARPKADPAVVVDAIVDAVTHVWGASDTDATPRLARWLGNIARVVYEKQYTLADAVHLTNSDSHH